MLKYLVLFVFLTFLYACSGPETVNQQAVSKEVSERLVAYQEAINKLDTETLIDFYSKSERFYWVEDGKLTYPNAAAVRTALSGLNEMLQSAEMQMLDSRIEVLNSRQVSIYAEFDQNMNMKSGFAFSINGAMTVLMEKESDGVWRYVIGHSSTKKER